MLSIVEPINLLDMIDRPNLGCAMLIGACREKGFETTLIQGQTRYTHDMFIREGEEIWNLYQDLEENETSGALVRYKELFKNKPVGLFQDELRRLYDEVITNKTIRSSFNAPMVRRFLTLYNDFAGLYHYYTNHLRYTELSLVQRYVHQIIKSNPGYLGWSLRGGFDFLSRTIRKIVKEKTGIPIILGGAFTPFIDLNKAALFFERESFDYLIIGAGEIALPALLDVLEHHQTPKHIPNVVYLEGKRIHAGEMDVISNLNELSRPDFSQFDLDRYPAPVRILPIQTARGCYWRKCAFCTHHQIDQGNYKEWKIDKVVETLAQLEREYSCSHFFLEDESVSPGRARKLSEAILQSQLQVKLDMRGRFEKGFNDKDLLALMRKAGFSSISWGLESGCQKILDAMCKGTRKETIREVLHKASRNRIANLCFIMCGFPTETRKDFSETMDFLMENDPHIDRVMTSVFEFERQASVGKDPEKWGIVVQEDGTIFTRTGMSREEVHPLHEKALDRYIKFLEGKRRFAKYLVSGYDSGQIVRMIIFFIFSHLLSKAEILQSIQDDNYEDVYPVLLGTFKRGEKSLFFFPVDSGRSLLDNYLNPEKEKPVNVLEAELFELADGTRNMAQISRMLGESGFAPSDGASLHEKTATFFRKIFSRDRGVALGQKT